MKVEVAVLGFRPNEPYGFCGRKATMLRHWSQFVPNMSTDIRGKEALHHHHTSVAESEIGYVSRHVTV